jgi:hypothetical protein
VIEKDVTIIDIFVLVDPKTGQSFQRRRGTDGAQDMLFAAAAPPETTPRTTPPTTPRTTPTTPPTTTHSTSRTSHTPST